MDAYSDMRARTTPIPTPPVVRVGTSVLFGLGVAVLATPMSRSLQVICMAVCIGTGLILIFSHPYRRAIRSFLEERNIIYRPSFWQVVPLFFVWLALMLVPAFAPLPWWGIALVGLAVFGWMYWTFPHIDGTRALAYA